MKCIAKNNSTEGDILFIPNETVPWFQGLDITKYLISLLKGKSHHIGVTEHDATLFIAGCSYLSNAITTEARKWESNERKLILQ